MKKFYIKPDSFVVKLNVNENIVQTIIPNASKYVDSGDIEAKEYNIDKEEWFSNGVVDYTEKWFND
ncbi:MAG: hypothetical protein J5808_02310 [Paludibacteraceae bacterium]|nr:hypothetical protein [Paludibacteraceae bacterium]